MTEKTFHPVSWAPSAIKDAVEHATEAFKAADGPYARVSTFELSALIDATRALIEHNEQEEAVDPEVERLTSELAAWRSGARRHAWPVIESVPDGITYAAHLVRAQGTEGGDWHDQLLREASQRMKALHDTAQVLLQERAVLSGLLRAAARKVAGLRTSRNNLLRELENKRDSLKLQLEAATTEAVAAEHSVDYATERLCTLLEDHGADCDENLAAALDRTKWAMDVLSWLHAEAVWHAEHHRSQVETQSLPLAVLRKGVRGLLDQVDAMARQIKEEK